MRLMLIGFLLLLTNFSSQDSIPEQQQDEFPDYWRDEYDSQWYYDDLENLGILEEGNKSNEKKNFDDKALFDDEPVVNAEFPDAHNEPEMNKLGDQQQKKKNIDANIKKEIQMFSGAKESFDAYDDYQVEDNRSGFIEKKDNSNVDSNNEDQPTQKDFIDNGNNLDGEIDDTNEKEEQNPKDNVECLALPAVENLSNKEIFEETKAILKKDAEESNESEKIQPLKADTQPNQEIVEETKRILAEPDTALDETSNDDIKVEKAQETEIESSDFSSYQSSTNRILQNMNAVLNKPKIDNQNENNIQQKESETKIDIRASSEIIDETKKDDLNQGTQNINNVKNGNHDVNPRPEIIEETKKILADSDNTFDEASKDENDDNVYEDMINTDDQEENPKNISALLNADLNELFETLNNIKNSIGEIDDNDLKIEDPVGMENILDYEEKHGRPYREGVVLDQRDDYENIDDNNLSDIFSENDDQLYDDFDDSKIEESLKDLLVGHFTDIKDAEPNPDDDMPVEKTKDEPILYLNDALIADDDNNKENEQKPEDASNQNNIEPLKTKVKSMKVDELSSTELDQLLQQFVILHSEDLDTDAADFDKHVAPIHMSLSVDEPTVITSPNYPKPYPANNIVDWIFDGEGHGIEFNITDFDVNGAIGDYLLVKPGGIDDIGSDGLVFSYHLKSERRYRFLDVARLFVRFEAKQGFTDNRGFKFSVKMISPPPEEPEPTPEPQPTLPPPIFNYTVSLTNFTVVDFKEVAEEFRILIADMATTYINAKDIDPGMKPTSEVAQITRAATCNINWPGYEACVQVTFSVPLVYDDDDTEPRLTKQDLDDMWNTYIYQDPFLTRLRQLGVQEFSSPNDSAIMLVWVVIAIGVAISMAMLAFALWRFSCFEDYTRMPAFSDSDSLADKKDLDLYPTPHQYLPPISDFYEDTTRVDMGGYTNKSYTRQEMYDIDSEEEIVTSKQSTGAFDPRDIYKV